MTYILRTGTRPEDYPRLAELLNSAGTQPVTAAELEEGDAGLPAGSLLHRTFAVDEAGRILGFSEAYRYPNTVAGKFYTSCVVEAGARRRGLGSALLAACESYAVAHGGNFFVGFTRDDDPTTLAYLEKRGYAVRRHAWHSALDLSAWDPAPFAGVVEAVQAGGIRLTTLADEPASEAQQKLYDLMARTMPDIPGYEAAQFMAFETWQNWVVKGAGPARVIIAADGDRYVGVTIAKVTEGAYHTDHTSVDRACRGRQIALALKLAAISQALALGFTRMTTGNDSLNQPMLAVNRKLGYVPSAGDYEICKRI